MAKRIEVSRYSGQLSNADIARELERKNLRIISWLDKHKPEAASFDITPSIIAMSSKSGMLETVYRKTNYHNDKYYIWVRPKDTVLVVSNEYVHVPANMAGYISSRVSKVVEGFGHISTTIDPLWSGALLIAVSNPTNHRLQIYVGDNEKDRRPYQLATMTLHYLNSPCEKYDVSPKKGMRLDLLKRIKYSERHGIRAWFNRKIHWRRKAYTDYFFSKVDDYDNITEDNWKDFQKEFWSPYMANDQSKVKEYGSKKSRKTAKDFIVTETFLVRLLNFVIRYRKPILVIIAVLLVFFIPTLFENIPEPVADFLKDIYLKLLG